MTACRACDDDYEDPVAFAVHLATSGHGPLHAEALTAGGELRPYYCTFPGCRQSFRTRTAKRIHETLRGHQRRQDRASNGDEEGRPGPRHPAYRTDEAV